MLSKNKTKQKRPVFPEASKTKKQIKSAHPQPVHTPPTPLPPSKYVLTPLPNHKHSTHDTHAITHLLARNWPVPFLATDREVDLAFPLALTPPSLAAAARCTPNAPPPLPPPATPRGLRAEAAALPLRPPVARSA